MPLLRVLPGGADNRRLSGRPDPRLTAAVYSRVHDRDLGEDAWHQYSSRCIKKFIHDHLPLGVCIDLGSGRYSYGVRAFRLDALITSFRDQRGVVGDLLRLPLLPESVDSVLCVGSVINYVPLAETLAEIRIALRRGGTLVLEYERVRRGALIAPSVVSYGGIEHVLWRYSDSFVRAGLSQAGFRVLDRATFHIVTRVLPVSAVSAQLDRVASRVPFMRAFGSNVILRAQRES